MWIVDYCKRPGEMTERSADFFYIYRYSHVVIVQLGAQQPGSSALCRGLKVTLDLHWAAEPWLSLLDKCCNEIVHSEFSLHGDTFLMSREAAERLQIKKEGSLTEHTATVLSLILCASFTD